MRNHFFRTPLSCEVRGTTKSCKSQCYMDCGYLIILYTPFSLPVGILTISFAGMWQSAAGELGSVLIILRGSSVQRSVFDTCYSMDGYTSVTACDKGVQSNATFLNELKMKLRSLGGTREQPAILLLDGHKTRLQRDVVTEAAMANVYIVIEPSHTSMIHQSLDNGTNAYLEAEYKKYYTTMLMMNGAYVFVSASVSHYLYISHAMCFVL